MSTLLMRLAAPMQSWGSGSRFTRRETMREPTKSGVTGMVAAALGRRRDESIADIAGLLFGVRIDRPGQLLRDFHTAHKETFWQNYRKDDAFTSERYYLADAVFLAGLEGDPALLQEIDDALQSPVFPLFLGRRSCPPEGRVSLGMRDCDLLTAMHDEPWLCGSNKSAPPLEIVYEAMGRIVTRDMPISFSQTRRLYGFRGVERMQRLKQESAAASHGRKEHAEHDPFSVLEDDERVSIEG